MGTSTTPEGRLSLPLVEVDPGRTRTMLAVRVEADGTVALGTLWEYAAKHGMRVIGATFNSIDDGGVVAYGMVDATEVGVEGAEGVLRGAPVDGVRGVEVHRSAVPGFAAAGGYVLDVSGDRSFVISEKTARGMLLGPRETFGESAGDALLYYVGLGAGRGRVRGLIEALGPENALEANWRMLEAMGWANSIRVSGGGDSYRLDVEHLVECEVLSGHLKGRTSHMFRGMVVGSLSAALGGEWDVEEVECVNDGSNECAFEARRRGQAEQTSTTVAAAST